MMIGNWIEVLRTCNLSPEKKPETSPNGSSVQAMLSKNVTLNEPGLQNQAAFYRLLAVLR